MQTLHQYTYVCVLKFSVTDVGLLMNKNRECNAHSPYGFRICYTYSASLAFEKTDNVGLRTNVTVRRVHISIVVV
jgi:hypothetical protein